MAKRNHDADEALAEHLRAALAPVTMPEPGRSRWRQRLVGAAGTPRAIVWWPRLAWAVALVIVVSAASTYGTFRLLSQRVVASAWEQYIVARTEQLVQHPHLWQEDPQLLARSLGVKQVYTTDVQSLPLTPQQLQRLGQGQATPGQLPAQLLIPLGPAEVMVLQQTDDVLQLAGGMQQVFWLSAGAGLAPWLIVGGYVWLRWRRSLAGNKEVVS